MKVFYWNNICSLYDLSIDEINKATDYFFEKGSSISVGCFDGPHYGHKVLFSSVLDFSKKNKIKSGLITFSKPLPYIKLKENYLGDISTLKQRLAYYELLGFDFCVVIDFSCDFSKMGGTTFLEILKKVCNIKHISEGKDFRFGYKGSSSIEDIKTFALENNLVADFSDLVLHNNCRVSSSNIRIYINNGNFDKVEELLQRPYALDLEEISYKKQDDAFTFARSNIFQVLPINGMYEVFAILPDKRLRTRLEVCSQCINLWGISDNANPRIRAIEFISNGGK